MLKVHKSDTIIRIKYIIKKHNKSITRKQKNQEMSPKEILNGYSELVDAQEQEKRLLEQSKLKLSGDEEAMEVDYEYIQAMEYGMPPISGWGLGVDRFMQFLTNRENIRDVVLYPLMKKKKKTNGMC